MPAHARKKSQPYPRPHRAFASNLQAPGPDHTPLSSDFGRRAFIRLMKCKVQTRVWYSWRMFHARTKRQRQTLRRHTEMQRTASIFRHFVAWKCLSNQLLETSCVIRTTITRWKQLLLGRGMNRWREMTERARRQRGLGQRAVLRWVRRHQARALAAWVQLVSDGRRRRRVVLHAARRWGQRSVAMAVDRWREMTERSRVCRLVAHTRILCSSLLSSKSVRCVMKSCFSCWRVLCIVSKTGRAASTSILSLTASLNLVESIRQDVDNSVALTQHAYVRLASDLEAEKQRSLRMLIALEGAQALSCEDDLAEAFLQFTSCVQYRRRTIRTWVDASFNRNEKQKLRDYVAMWRILASSKKRSGSLACQKDLADARLELVCTFVNRIATKWLTLTRARALAAWVQLVSDGRRRRRVVLHAARRWGQRSVAMAVDRWREMAAATSAAFAAALFASFSCSAAASASFLD